MRRSAATAAVVTVLLAAAPLFGQPAATATPSAFTNAAEDVRQAIRNWDFRAMTNAVAHLQALDPASDDERLWRALWTGTATFHAVLYLNGSGGDATAALERTAVEALDQALALDPANSDAHAMLAVLYGIAIGRRPLQTLVLGPRLNRHREAAATADETNPRVSYLEGVSLLRRAGKDREVEAAMARLTHAETLFARQDDGSLATDGMGWGRPHTLLFLGEAAERLGRHEEALKWFREAVRLAPRLERARKGMERCQMRLQSR